MEAFPSMGPTVSFDTPETRPNPPALHTRPQNRRRKSSNLGGDPRGDTGATAFATMNLSLRHQDTSSPTTTSSSGKPLRQSKRRKAKTLLNRFKRTSLKHTWVIPLILVVVILGLYYIDPGEHNPVHHAIFLSYANPPLDERTDTLPAHVGNVTQYGKGPKDIAFVAFYTIVLSFTREFLMQRMIQPIAIWCGIRSRAKLSRFMEQFYTAIYFGIFGPFGLYVMSRTPVWYFNTAGMYEGFPHRAHEGLFKAYYLLQASYWAQQGLVLMLQLEKPRKDFKELVLHHIVTLSLIGLSYCFHFTYMGVAVYITHDISDFFLATSKVFNYLDLWIITPYFAIFIAVWAYLRHYINLTIIMSLLPGGQFETVGPYQVNWETQQYKCWISQAITFGLLAVLQAVNIFWFVLILRILYRLLVTSEAKDERSDDEEEEDDLQPLAPEADKGTPQMTLNGEPFNQTEASGADVNRKASLRKR